MKHSNRGSRIAVVRSFALAALIAAPAAAVPSGPVTPPEPDVLLTELVIRPDIAARRLYVEATLHIANPGSRNSFTFLLADWYSSVAVRSRSGPASVLRDKGVVEVRVRRPSREERLVFRLSGMPGKSGGEARPVIDDDSLFLLWSDRFYPVDFDDWSILRARVELPESFRVLAPGCRTTLKEPGNRRVEVFETSEPIRAATILADTRWIVTERTVWRPAPAHFSLSRRAASCGTRPGVERRRSRLLRVAFRPVRLRRVQLRDGRRNLRAKSRGGGSDLLARVPRPRDALHRPRRARDRPALVVLYRGGERTRKLPVDRRVRRLRGGPLRRGARPADPGNLRILPLWIPANGRDGRGAFHFGAEPRTALGQLRAWPAALADAPVALLRRRRGIRPRASPCCSSAGSSAASPSKSLLRPLPKGRGNLSTGGGPSGSTGEACRS